MIQQLTRTEHLPFACTVLGAGGVNCGAQNHIPCSLELGTFCAVPLCHFLLQLLDKLTRGLELLSFEQLTTITYRGRYAHPR